MMVAFPKANAANAQAPDVALRCAIAGRCRGSLGGSLGGSAPATRRSNYSPHICLLLSSDSPSDLGGVKQRSARTKTLSPPSDSPAKHAFCSSATPFSKNTSECIYIREGCCSYPLSASASSPESPQNHQRTNTVRSDQVLD